MNAQKTKDNGQYVSLPFFGLPKILKYIRKYRSWIAIMVTCGVLASVGDIAIPFFQRYALNHLEDGVFIANLVPFILFYVLTLLGKIITDFISSFLSGKVELSVLRDLRKLSFDHLQTLSFSYFNQNSVGYIHARVMSDTSRIGELVSWVIMQGVWNFSYLIGVVIVMLSMNVKLTLLILAVIPLITVFFAIFQKKLVNENRHIREVNSKITGNFNEGITGAKTIKTLVIEDRVERDFVRDSKEMKRSSVMAQRYRSILAAMIGFASSIALAIVVWKGGELSLIGNDAIGYMDVGTLSLFMSYALGIIEPIRWIVDMISDLVREQVNIERLTRLLETKSDVTDTPEVIEKYGDTFSPKKENWETLHGDIEFRDVSFKYPDGDEYILEHFNLKIPQGSNIAIVGETGAGKSTLVNLICRFYEPTSGQLLIDGRDARERSQLWLHSNIGYVLQTPHLFSGTILENLRYGKPDATIDEINDALRRVSADGVVAKAENGLETNVGEGGDLLSTGEKQLISFARAIVADPKILILDEATASIDTLTEQNIQKAISEVIRGRTSIMIAHRLSTVRDADMILVVSDGKIVERGTHSSLMKQKGHYYSLYTRQYEEDVTKTLLN
ncbi:MAG: ABC transporter ATP-binding protein/permease [Eubacterium sp.]|nr:ABC transporter ATP-binding protein/permease [Eubacterium sp.]